MSRFDHRDIDTFKKDIYFATNLEKYFFNKWVSICKSRKDISIKNPRDNGVDNDGGFIEKGVTAGADYMVDVCYSDLDIKNMPLEVKWVPMYGKLTLKTNDLKGYIREKAGILFIYHSQKSKLDFRKPKDYDLTKHIQMIESTSETLRWGIMYPDIVKGFLQDAEDSNKVEKIPYMGYKPGVILKQNEFKFWFNEEKWE